MLCLECFLFLIKFLEFKLVQIITYSLIHYALDILLHLLLRRIFEVLQPLYKLGFKFNRVHILPP